MNRSYSRRELYALGEPLGDSATYRKAGGLVSWRRWRWRWKCSTAPDKTTQVAELPEWARPYAKDTLAKGAALTDINQNPYQTYGGNRIAGFSATLQQTVVPRRCQHAAIPAGGYMGSDLAAAAGIGALGTNYQAGQFTNLFQDPGRFRPGQFSMSQVGAPNLQNFQMGPAERVRTQSLTRPGSAEQYTSPDMQNVVDIQKREAASASLVFKAHNNRRKPVRRRCFWRQGGMPSCGRSVSAISVNRWATSKPQEVKPHSNRLNNNSTLNSKLVYKHNKLISRPVLLLGVKTLAQDLAFNSLAQDKIYSLNWQINKHSNKHKVRRNNHASTVLVRGYKLLDSALNTDKLPNNWVSSLVSMVLVLVCKDFKPPCQARRPAWVS
jgi:hypothetical protein